jgi:predicted nucleotidyltransferase
MRWNEINEAYRPFPRLWLGPKGEVIECVESHAVTILQNAEQMGLDPDQLDGFMDDDGDFMYETAFAVIESYGWCRTTRDSNTGAGLSFGNLKAGRRAANWLLDNGYYTDRVEIELEMLVGSTIHTEFDTLSLEWFAKYGRLQNPRKSARPLKEGLDPAKNLDKVCEMIVSLVPEAEEIWFHGSRATGKQKRGSDWDFYVFVSEDTPREILNSYGYAGSSLSRLRPKIDVQVGKKSSIWAGSVGYWAMEEGRKIWSKTVTEDHMIITELFDTKGISWESPTKARFEVNGTSFIAVFKQDLGGGNHYDFSFYQAKPGEDGQEKTTFNNTGETGSAAARVFGYALECVETFINSRHPGSIAFTGLVNDGRDKLYGRMVRVLGKKLEANGYDVSTKSFGPDSYMSRRNGPGTTWTLKRTAAHKMPPPKPYAPKSYAPEPEAPTQPRTPEQKKRDDELLASILDELGED